MSIYVWCGCASVVPGKRVVGMYACVHFICCVLCYVISGCACIEHAMRVCHMSVQRCYVCTCDSTRAYVQYVWLCLCVSYCTCLGAYIYIYYVLRL